MRTPQVSRAQWLRRLALRRRDRVAFVFSGGGPLGALQVGALRALFEHNVHPDLVVGSSVGALNATFVAFDPTLSGVDALEGIWRSLTDQDLFPGSRLRATWARFLVRGDRVFENSGLRRLVQTRLGDARIDDAQLPLGIVATDLDRGEERIFTTGELTRPLLASTAMPGIFPPVEIDDRRYIDGGVSNNVPIAPAVAMGAKIVYVLNSTAAESRQHRPLVRPLDYMLHSFSLARAQRLEVDRRIYNKKVRLVMLPTPELDFYVPFASMEHTGRLIDLGYEQTRSFLRGETEVVAGPVTPTVEAIAPAK